MRRSDVPIGQADSAQVPASVERFVKQLVITLKAVMLYPAASSIPRENAEDAVDLLRAALQDSSEVRLLVSKDAVFFDDVPLFEGQPAFESFARELYNRSLAEVRFHSGAGAQDILRFLGVLAHPPAELAEAGGFEARLWDMGVDAVTVRESTARIVSADDGAVEPGDEEEWPPCPRRIDELLAEAYGSRPRDQRLLIRIIEDPAATGPYLVATVKAGGTRAASKHLAELAHLAALQPQERRAEMYRALRDALEALDPDVRRKLILEQLRSDTKVDDALASVIRQIDIDEICGSLVESLGLNEIDSEGLARAIRYLALISVAEREEILNAAGAAMREAGVSEERINDVFEAAAPSRLTVESGDSRPQSDDHSVDSILRMIDLAPTKMATRFHDDPEYVKLQEESRRGITDGDVVRALVTVVAVDTLGSAFDGMISLVEDMIGHLVDRGEYEVAADAAENLMEASRRENLEPQRRDRMIAVIRKLADTHGMHEVTKAMRMYRPGAPEHESCRHLLEVLGTQAIDPLLETLADEPDMAARKALVDLISDLAPHFIDDLVLRASDPRWYVVRNVVSILGRTKNPAALPALERTFRHSDARVRRETVRALAGVKDRLAEELLVAALEDSDAQNVQLAARYLGITKSRGASAALQRVAAGDGRGNRENGPRVEAIESLGRIGAQDALPLLRSLKASRKIIGAGRMKELKAAADTAISMITNAPGTGKEGRTHE